MVPQFCDISEWQPQNIDWQAYKAWSAQWDGISRVAIRSSYGVGYTDQHFTAYRSDALNADIDQVIYYHYSYPDTNYAYAEANWQKQVVGDVRTQDLLILDFEESVPQATAEWADEWLAQQESNYGKLPGIYASSAYIQQRLQDQRLARYKLWLANWQFTPDERPPVPAPWTSYEFVQYTDNATGIPGIPGTVDCNIFLGGTTPMAIDLTNPTVASHFAGGGPDIWQCKDNGFLIGYAILKFYQQYGGNALCGLTYLGLPRSNEISANIANHPEIVYQRFERGVLCYDPNRPHIVDNPPGAENSDVFLLHIDSGLGQDPHIAQLQAQIANLQALLSSSNLGQISTIGQQIQSDIALIMKLAQPQ